MSVICHRWHLQIMSDVRCHRWQMTDSCINMGVFANVAIWSRNEIAWTIMWEMRANTLRLPIFHCIFLGLPLSNKNARPRLESIPKILKFCLVLFREIMEVKPKFFENLWHPILYLTLIQCQLRWSVSPKHILSQAGAYCTLMLVCMNHLVGLQVVNPLPWCLVYVGMLMDQHWCWFKNLSEVWLSWTVTKVHTDQQVGTP